MNISIRSHIIENFKNDSIEEIKDAIVQSVNDTDEEVLPGLGVFFSLFWSMASDEIKEEVVQLIKKAIEKN